MFKVFLVDDERWALVGIKKMFAWEDNGFEAVGETTDPVEALYQINELRPDVVFTDIRMPELSGIELMQKVREAGCSTRFVVVSGFGEFSYAQAALRQGAFDYLLKPLSFEDAGRLMEKLRTSLEEEKKENDSKPSEEVFENESFNQLLNYVKSHYMEELYLKQLSAQFFINASYCSELFKKLLGKTFTDYINQLRIDKACYLLENTHDSVETIAEKTGFKDYYYFSKVFKKYTELTPYKYRKERQSARGVVKGEN